jgi:acetylornithine deacetylase
MSPTPVLSQYRGRGNLMIIDVPALTHKLVAIPSETTRSNVPIIEKLDGVLSTAGFETHIQEVRETLPGSGRKVNLLAEIGSGSQRLVFSGHVDTVPVGDPDTWDHDPLGADGFVDGVLFGRGSLDMKGQVAAMCAAAADAGDSLDNLTVMLAITADEESGHWGIKALAAEHVFESAVGAVICEPTTGAVYRAHKGGMTTTVDVRGKSCHSSRPHEGVNAIVHAARFISALEDRLREWGDFRHPAFDDDPQTFTVAQIEGGVAVNVVPASCGMQISCRVLHERQFGLFRDHLKAICLELAESDAEAGIEPDRRFHANVHTSIWAPPMITDENAEIHQLVKALIGQEENLYARFGTDGGVLSHVGLPCVIWGPGDIGRAHAPDEYITRDELMQGYEGYLRLIREVATRDLPTTTTTLWTP